MMQDSFTKRDALSKVIKFTFVFTVLIAVLVFLVQGSLLHEQFRVVGFGNLHAYLFDSEKIWLNILFLLLELVALALCLLYFRIYRDEATILSLGLQVPNAKNVGIGALIGLLIPSIFFMIVYLNNESATISADGISPSYLFHLLVIFLMVAFVEELLFRGYILGTLMKAFSPIMSMIISSAVFALLHVQNIHITPLQLFNIFLFGCLQCQLLFYTKKLWMPITVHFVWNFATTIFFYLLTEDPIEAFHEDGFNRMNDSIPSWIPILVLLLLISTFIYLNQIGNSKKANRISEVGSNQLTAS